MATTARQSNSFVIIVSAAVVVVLAALAGLVWFLNNQATAPGDAPAASSSFDPDTGAVIVGTGENTVDTYVDFLCPNCGAFESSYGEELQQAAADGKITLNIHPVSILDRSSQGTEYSSRSGNAAVCVASESPDSFLTFFNLLFANQPSEGTTGLTDAQLSSYAEQAGASSKATECIADGTYKKFVQDQTKQMPSNPSTGKTGTPTVEVNGEYVELADVGTQFADLLG